MAPRALLVTGALAGGAGLLALAHWASRPPSVVADTPSARLRAVALVDLPDAATILTLGNPLWDLMLGGRKPDYLGGPAWGYYSTFAGLNPDGTKRKGGTTCGTVAAYWAARAGFPADMIDRLPTDPAPGSGFTPGASISKFYQGAQRRGWVRTGGIPGPHLAGLAGPPLAIPQAVIVPGDYYCIVKDGATYNGQPSSGEHVEVCLDVSAPNAKGDRTVRSAAGGQECGDKQCAHWVTRILTTGGMLVRDGEARRLAWIVRAGALPVA